MSAAFSVMAGCENADGVGDIQVGGGVKMPPAKKTQYKQGRPPLRAKRKDGIGASAERIEQLKTGGVGEGQEVAFGEGESGKREGGVGVRMVSFSF